MTIKRNPNQRAVPGDFPLYGPPGGGGGGKSIVTGKKSSVSKKTKEKLKAEESADAARKAAMKKRSAGRLKDVERTRQKEYQQKIKKLKAAGKVEKKDYVVARRAGKIEGVYTSRSTIEEYRKTDNFFKAQQFREKADNN